MKKHKDSNIQPSADAVAETIQHYVDKLSDILDSFEQSHPEWRSGIMMLLLQLALNSLRGYIEREEEPEITWANPYVEIRFPVAVQCEPEPRILATTASSFPASTEFDKESPKKFPLPRRFSCRFSLALIRASVVSPLSTSHHASPLRADEHQYPAPWPAARVRGDLLPPPLGLA